MTLTGFAPSYRDMPDRAGFAYTFTEKQLADLTIAVGLMNTYNRLAISFCATPLAAAA